MLRICGYLTAWAVQCFSFLDKILQRRISSLGTKLLLFTCTLLNYRGSLVLDETDDDGNNYDGDDYEGEE